MHRETKTINKNIKKMKINLQKLGEQAIETTTDQTKMRLSEDASSMVFQLFTKNVYSNPIGTVVREITSNCFDSHVEAGVNLPVIIRKHKDEQVDTQYISFIDYGVGMSPDRVENIYGVYFESTKRVDNEQIGGFGIGGKTPLAYKRSTGQGEGEYDNSFYVITTYDGIKYFYCIYEGAESPVISKLHEEATTDGNGTEIRIPVLEKDIQTFQNEMTKQLYYFENVVFEGFEYEHSYNKDNDGNPTIINPLPNDYQIIRAKSFLFRGGEYRSEMHVCLGRVAYPIDYDVLGLESDNYRLPIAIKLEVGDIGVTVSRESLDYSETTIKILKKKLEDARAEIIKLINNQYKSIKSLEQYFEMKHDFGRLEFKNGGSMYVGNLVKQKDVDLSNFKYGFMNMPNDKQLFRFFFETSMYGKKPRKSRYGSNNNEFDGGYENLKSEENLVYVDGVFNRKIVKQAYLKSMYTTYYLIRKRNIASNWVRSDIADLFSVSIDNVQDDKGEIIPFVQSLIEMQEEFFTIVQKHCNDYNTLEVPEDFVASRKRNAGMSPELRKRSISVKFHGGYSRDRVTLSRLFDYNMPIFYGTADEEHELHNAHKLFALLFDKISIIYGIDYRGEWNVGNEKRNIMFIQLAKNNIKYMEHCKNAKPVSHFFKTMLRRKEDVLMKYFQNHIVIDEYESLSGFYRKGFIDMVDTKWGKKIDVVKTYISNLPTVMKNDNIKYNEDWLKNYFDVDKLKQTPEQRIIIARIKKIKALEAENVKMLKHINLPYDSDEMDNELITILQVIMSL